MLWCKLHVWRGTCRSTKVLLALILVHTTLLAYSATQHSPVFVEGSNFIAGIRFWQTGQHDLFKVNPPLSRIICALPVVIAGVDMDWSALNTRDLRPEYLLAEDFFDANGSRSIWLCTLARWVCIPFSTLGLIVCFLWGRELYGRSSGLLAAALWCIAPDFIAHGALATADTASAAIGLLAGYFYWRWLRCPTWPRATATGGAFGLALLSKSTWLILVVLWPLLWAIYRALDHDKACKNSGREISQMTGILTLGVLLLNAGYGFQGSFQLLASYEFTSETLGGPNDHQLGTNNRFRDSLLGSLPLPVPKPYLEGIDLQKRDFELGYQSYRAGRWQSPGWWYYYLYAFLLKTPLGIQCMCLMAITSVLYRPHRYLRQWNDEACLLLPIVAIFGLVSSQTGMNHHYRYVLPALPFLYVSISRIVCSFDFHCSRRSMAVLALLAWTMMSSLWIFPHSLSYFNEAIGGPRRGHLYLLHSNLDWGQDLMYFKQWFANHSETDATRLTYYGVCRPRAVGIDLLGVPRGPGEDTILGADQLGPQPGWYAISVNIQLDQSAIYSYLLHFRPVAMAGYSIRIYHITLDEANRVRRELGQSTLTCPP